MKVKLDEEFIKEDRERSRSERFRMLTDLALGVFDKVPHVNEDMIDFNDQCTSADLIPPIPTPEGYREYLHLLHFAGMWAQLGFNVFELPFDLAGSFLMTEPAKVEGELHLPFKAFVIHLPPGIIPMFVDDEQLWVEQITVHRFVSIYKKTDEKSPFLRVMCHAKGTQLWRDRKPDDLEQSDNAFTQVFENDPAPVPQDDLTLDHAFRIVKNLVTWLDFTGGLKNQERKKVSKKARKKAEKGDRTATAVKTWILGSDVRLVKDLRDRVRDFALGNTRAAPEGWKVRVKHIVRGHWKMQAHGEGRAERKRLWVEPYWRGPEGAQMAHVYKGIEKKQE